MQRTLLTVLVHPVIVIQPIGQVAAFLNLRDQRSRADGVNGARLDKKDVIFRHRDGLQIGFHGAVFNTSSQNLRGNIPAQAVNQLRALCRIQHIPHLRLAPLPIFVDCGICVRGMHLHRQILFRVDELDKNGQIPSAVRMGTKKFRVRFQNIRKAQRVEFTPHGVARAVRVGRALPGLRQRLQSDALSEFVVDSAAAPEIVLPRGTQENRFSHNSNSYFFLSPTWMF